jgi:hypothetical protein
MRFLIYFSLLFVVLSGCEKPESDLSALLLLRVESGGQTINITEPLTEEVFTDRPISLIFSQGLDPESITGNISLLQDTDVDFSHVLTPDKKTLILYPSGQLKKFSLYKIRISSQLKAANGGRAQDIEVVFRTVSGDFTVLTRDFQNSQVTKTGRIVDVPTSFSLKLEFSLPISSASISAGISIQGQDAPQLGFELSNENSSLTITGLQPLKDFTKYTILLNSQLKAVSGQAIIPQVITFYTGASETPKFPVIPDELLLTKVQEQTFKYFYDFAHAGSGMARERNTSGDLVTTGGSGFGLMALLVGIERGFISRQQALERFTRIVDYLERAERYHGVWPHWLNGNSGSVIPFSAKDNGGDLVETAFLIQGLLAVRAYLNPNEASEKQLIDKITALWHGVEWSWYTRGGQQVLFWHWSPNYNWDMNLPINGYNESLIVYVLAAASPTYAIGKQVYDTGWARQGAMVNGNTYFGHKLPLGETMGGPLFFAHYSFLGMDPRNLRDSYAAYWEQNVNHSRINQAYCIDNPLGYVGYSEAGWGLTASDNHLGYNAHSPTNDLGVITPTAALSSIPYTPEASMKALRHFYYELGDRLWGPYGFYDAYNLTEGWYANSYLAIDQGPIVVMIENYRTQFLWKLMMQDQDLKTGLDRLNFIYN